MAVPRKRKSLLILKINKLSKKNLLFSQSRGNINKFRNSKVR